MIFVIEIAAHCDITLYIRAKVTFGYMWVLYHWWRGPPPGARTILMCSPDNYPQIPAFFDIPGVGCYNNSFLSSLLANHLSVFSDRGPVFDETRFVFNSVNMALNPQKFSTLLTWVGIELLVLAKLRFPLILSDYWL